MIMVLVRLTGWSVRHITHEVSLATLLILMQSGKKEDVKPTGLLADPNLDVNKLKELGFGVM